MNLHYKSTLLLQGDGSKELINTLSSDEHTMLQAIDKFAFGFLKLDLEGKILYWSSAAEKLTGYRAEDVLNKSIFEAVAEVDYIKFHKKWQILRHNTHHLRFREYYWASQSWLEFYIYSTDKCIVIYFKDISKKIAIRKKLSLKINQLREVSIFNSHEIRKSLANLIGLTDMLSVDFKLEEIRKFISYINRSAKDLDNLIINVNAIVNDNDYSIVPKLTFFSFKGLISEIREEFIQKTNPLQFDIRCAPVFFYGNREEITVGIKSLICILIAQSSGQVAIKIQVSVKNGLLYIH
ncbi:MAG: PAS domain-containing protein, partial [Pedobacter sp.]